MFFGKGGMFGVVTSAHEVKLVLPGEFDGSEQMEYRYGVDLWWKHNPDRVESDSLPESILELRTDLPNKVKS